MKLEINSITIRNFLSYGNQPQTINFKNGVNLIIGKTEQTERSNGSGKSSFLFSIPFALFGKFNNSIKKEDIPNWQNKKNCVVTIDFSKGDNNYRITRSIKPDKLEIYENNNLIPIPSDVRSYQKYLEDDILKIDYNTFMYLFYTNLNTNVPLLKMSTAQKRTFLEKMFMLDTYTELNTTVNEKIKDLDNNIFKDTVTIEHNDKETYNLKQQNENLSLKLVDVKPFEDEINTLTNEYNHKNELIDCNTLIDNGVIKEVEKDVINEQNIINKIDLTISIQKNNKANVLKNIEEREKREEEKSLKIKKIEKVLSEIRVDEATTIPCNDDVELVKNKINELLQSKTSYYSDISLSKERIKNIEEKIQLLKDEICPTCGQKLSKSVTNNFNDLLSKENDTLSELNKSLEDIENSLNDNKKLLVSYKKIISENNDRRKKIDEYTTILNTLKDELCEKTHTLETDVSKYDKVISEQLLLKDEHELILDEKNKLLKKLNDKWDISVKLRQELQDLKNKIENLSKELELRKSNSDEIHDIIEKNKEKIKNIVKLTKTTTNSINKRKDLLDYLHYLKLLCKDENVKQYAISSYLSYLTQQVNFYLSKTGSSHYLKFDKWLDETICGSGINEAKYGSLSGGEARSIDLAIQFAFLDIAKMKKGIFPDILLLDEILDSSIDGGGLNNILNIIKTKQYDENSKVFIITHRQEISDIDADNTYLITKKEGFSTIKKL